MKIIWKIFMQFVWLIFVLALLIIVFAGIMFWIKGNQPMHLPEAQKMTYFQFISDRETAYHENEALYGTAEMLKCTPSSRPLQAEVFILPSKVLWAALIPQSPVRQTLQEPYRSQVPENPGLKNCLNIWWQTLETVTWQFTVSRENLAGSAACQLRPPRLPEGSHLPENTLPGLSGTEDAPLLSTPLPDHAICAQWSDISLQNVGQSLCVQGMVSSTASRDNAFFLLFGSQPEDFFILSYDAEFHEAEGKCVQVNGQVQQLGKAPVIVIGANDLLYCPAE